MSTLTVQVPDPILAGARKLAEREHISVEEFVARMLAATVNEDGEWESRRNRGGQVSRKRFLEILSSTPDVPPIVGDEKQP